MRKTTWQQFQSLFPGGVNSPVRAFQNLGVLPLSFVRGKGPYLYEQNGRRYLDFVLAFGPHILGHAPEVVVRAVSRALKKGFHFGTCHELELKVAREVRKYFPSLEKMRFLNSGTEALMTAARLARGYTQRDLLVIFEGGYHGHADSFLVSSGSGLLTHGLPKSAGVPKGIASHTIVLPYNDSRSAEKLFQRKGKKIAAVIVEPVAGNMGLILPKEHFLPTLAWLTKKHGALLILDEVITAFRERLGGAQHAFEIEPDLTCMGKAIGGGFPFALLGGKREIMERLSPSGDVYQAGTMSANPIALTAAYAVLKALPHYRKEYLLWAKELDEMKQTVEERGLSMNHFGLAFSIFFSPRLPENLKEVQRTDMRRYESFFRRCLKKFIFIPPSPFETCFLSFTHRPEHLKQLLEVLFSR